MSPTIHSTRLEPAQMPTYIDSTSPPKRTIIEPVSSKASSVASASSSTDSKPDSVLELDREVVMPSFGEPRARFTVTFAEHPPLKIKVPDVSAGAFAHRLWRAGFLLARAVFIGEEIDVKDRAVLELGCGIGLPGIAASLRGAAFVRGAGTEVGSRQQTALTDYDDPRLLADIEENLKAAPPHGPARVIGHTWGRSVEELLEATPATEAGYDILLAADVCWDQWAHLDLAKSVSLLLARRPTARFHLIAGFHTGRATLARFFERIEAKGLEIERIVEAEVKGGTIEQCGWSGRQRPWQSREDEPEPIEQRNRWLVRATLKWRDL